MSTTPMKSYRYEVSVEWGDCDPAGIVHYPNFYAWMDAATFHLFDSVGLGWKALQEEYDAPGLPLVSAHADFKRPGYFTDALTIEAWVSEWGGKSLTVSHRVMRGEELLVEGYETRIWSKGDPMIVGRIVPTDVPEEVKRKLS